VQSPELVQQTASEQQFMLFTNILYTSFFYNSIVFYWICWFYCAQLL